jgi:hypothetical protein
MGEIHEISPVSCFRQAPLVRGFGFGALELPSQCLDSLNLLLLNIAHFQLGADDAKVVDDGIPTNQVDVGRNGGPIGVR